MTIAPVSARPGSDLDDDEAGERGTLDINQVVLRKVVEHASNQVPGMLRRDRRIAGIDVGESGAKARITLGNADPTAVDVRLEVTLSYPAEIRVVVDAVRAKVDAELSHITGHHLRSLSVTVAGLRAVPATAATRLR